MIARNLYPAAPVRRRATFCRRRNRFPAFWLMAGIAFGYLLCLSHLAAQRTRHDDATAFCPPAVSHDNR